MFLRLNKSFSDSGSPRDSNRNISSHSLRINNGFIVHLFSEDGSADFHFSDNRGLNNSLSDDGLSDGFFSDGWLDFNFSFDFSLRNEFLGLVDLRS